MRTVAKPEGKRKRAQEVGVDRERLEGEGGADPGVNPAGFGGVGKAVKAEGVMLARAPAPAGGRQPGRCAGPNSRASVLGIRVEQKLPVRVHRVHNQLSHQEVPYDS
jgi:hypothetical protein